MGHNGPTGLDYAGVWCLIDQRIRRRDRRTVFWLMQAMESATLAEYHARQQIEQAHRR